MNLEALTLRQFLDDLAAKSPIPGGGAVASVTGAVAAALAGMVVAYSLGKKDLAEHQPALERASKRLQEFRADFLSLAEEDARAYAALNSAMRLDKADPARAGAIEAAVKDAIAAPAKTLEQADALVTLCEALALISNRHLRSDLGIAAILARAAACASHWNVSINAPILDESAPGEGALALAHANRVVADCRRRAHHVESLCANGV